MPPKVEFSPPTILFSAPFSGEKAGRGVKITNKSGEAILIRAKMEAMPTEFAVSLDGYAVIFPGQAASVTVRRTVQSAPIYRDGTYDKIKFYWHSLIQAEVSLLYQANYHTFRKIWDNAAERARRNRSKECTFDVPIEVYNPKNTQRPFKTWKDPREWTPFVYRPGVDNRNAVFQPEDEAPRINGGFGSVWKCKMKLQGDSEVYAVALKEIRLSGASLRVPINRKRVLTRAEKELAIWKNLNHQNVGSMIGWLIEENMALMSPWYPNGNVLTFVQNLPQLKMNINDQRLRRWELVKEIADGMEYLHSRNVVHGDLRYDQVLVDGDWHVKIVDFGLSGMIEEGVDNKITTSIRGMGRTEYMAPELFSSIPSRLKESDVYAFGLLMLEVAAARRAFDGPTPGPAEITRRMNAKTPTHLPTPSKFKQELQERSRFWDIFYDCTHNAYNRRLTMQRIAYEIRAVRSPHSTIYTPLVYYSGGMYP